MMDMNNHLLLKAILPKYMMVLDDPTCMKIIEVLNMNGALTLRNLMIKMRIPTEDRKRMSVPIARLLDVGAIYRTEGAEDRRNRYHQLDDGWYNHVMSLYDLIKGYRES